MRKLLQGAALVVGISITGAAMATEEPKYQVMLQDGDFELREYELMLVAEVWVDGSFDQAGNRGFRLLADFIFGNNTSIAGEQREIAMTAPVTMEPQSEEISMTSPVTMEQQQGKWRVHFVMPSRYTYEMLPKPNNPAVQIREVPKRTYAVIQYSGFAGEEKTSNKTEQLLNWIEQQQFEIVGNPEMARYDPPWTLPFFRRNEVMIAVQPKS